jgi:hypothetical protein
MEGFWLDKTKSDNWSFRFFIRPDLKWAIMSVRLAPKAAITEREARADTYFAFMTHV